MNKNKNQLLGYQIIDANNNHPETFETTEVLSMKLVDFWVKNFATRKNILIRPVYVGDIENVRLIDLEDPPEDVLEMETLQMNHA